MWGKLYITYLLFTSAKPENKIAFINTRVFTGVIRISAVISKPCLQDSRNWFYGLWFFLPSARSRPCVWIKNREVRNEVKIHVTWYLNGVMNRKVTRCRARSYVGHLPVRTFYRSLIPTSAVLGFIKSDEWWIGWVGRLHITLKLFKITQLVTVKMQYRVSRTEHKCLAYNTC